MYYSLIPPVLAILSIIGIIVFLLRKSSQVAEIAQENIETEAIHSERRGFFGKIWHKIKNVKWDDVKHFFFGITEKIVRRSRIIFLKLESKFGDISNDIRAKRQSRLNRKAEEKKKVEEKNKKIFEAKGNQQEKKIIPEIEIKKVYEEEEVEVKPMLSEKITIPESMVDNKSKFEEALIERIAVNPKDMEAYERLGEYYMETKNYIDAKECFKQVLKLNPSNRNIKYKIRRLEYLLSK